MSISRASLRVDMLFAAAAGKSITTIEGLSTDRSHPVQKAWIERDVPLGCAGGSRFLSASSL